MFKKICLVMGLLVVDPVVNVHCDVQCRRPEVSGPGLMFKKNRMCIMMCSVS